MKSTKYLYERQNYLIDARFIYSVSITEYDIRQANISTLYSAGRISEDEYMKLSRLPKYDREVAVGLMIQKDPKVSDIIKNGIISAKKDLFSNNSIQDTEVVRIANDAVYIMRNSPLRYTKFGLINFIPKHNYSMFCRVANLTFFYKSELGEIELDVIGLGKDQKILHLDYMLSFIGNLFYLMDSESVGSVIDYFNDFYKQYISKQLPLPYYRELNSSSMYCLLSPNDKRFGMTEYNGDINQLDISYNACILRELYGCITELHHK